MPKVFLDGKSMGSLTEAYPKLNDLNVDSRDRIKIAIPIATELHKPHRAIYGTGRFLGTWLKRGAHLRFFQGNKEYQGYALTWSQYLTPDGKWKSDLSTAHLVLNNQDIGKVDVGLRKISEMQWDHDKILQIYFPYTDPPLRNELIVPEKLFSTSDQLESKYGISVEVISPVF